MMVPSLTVRLGCPAMPSAARWLAVALKRLMISRSWMESIRPSPKGLLFAQGIRGIKVKSQCKTLAVDKLVTGDGHRLPPRLACEIARELQRLAMVQEQIAEIERERDTAPTPCEATERKRQLLLQLK